ncbi:glycosyltransferase family 4 protein [Phocaeicola sp. HCN-40430]|uniref:glycosyltransferase family 4 protein n=1 Tax=Phocaeicola sp. HCN-40430 TaxID=3134664 RepID=UPI0030EF78E2
MGSEPGMAWNWCINLAKHCELHIITEGEFRDNIEKVLPTLPQGKNMYFYYNPVSDKVRKMCWNQGDWRFYYYYNKWQKKTLQIANEIIKEHHIDLIHQLNMVGFREPGYLWKIENKPFIWGPIAGIGSIPFSFMKDSNLKFKLFYILKNQITALQLRYSSKVNSALKSASLLITATPETGQIIKKIHNIDSIQINETGCSIKEYTSDIKKDDTFFDILWVGRFIYTKQLKLALDVINQIKNLKNIRFHIVGQAFNAEETEKYKKYAQTLGIDNICVWHGQIPNNEVLMLMQKSHLFFFTSIFEATSTVILEAIQNKLPIVCFDRCGFGPIVDSSIGRKIQLSTPQNAIIDFAREITELYNHKNLLDTMSNNCIKKQQELSWDNKAKQMVELYNSIAQK